MSGLLSHGPLIADRAGGRDNNFNLIRMIAATGVLVSHAWPIALGPAAVQPLQTLLQGTTLGAVCVYVFFAISGFFITRSFDTRRAPVAFLTARARRLFPALAAVLLVTVLVAGLLLTTTPAPVFWLAGIDYFAKNLTLAFLRYDLPGVFEANPYPSHINGSLWTLFYEVFCYMSIFAAGMAGLIARPRWFGLAAIGFLAFYGAAQMTEVPGRLQRVAQLGLPFLIGASFWVWRDRIRLSIPILAGLVGVLAIVWTTPLFTPVLMLALAYGTFLLGYARLPGIGTYNRLGDYSYGIYVWAFPIQQCVAATGIVSPTANILISMPFTFVCAILSWHFIEEPAMYYGKTGGPSKRWPPAAKRS